MVKALVVYCHPCEGSFVSALRDRVVDGLSAAGHEVDLVDLYADGFDPRLTEQEHTDHGAGETTKRAAAPYADRLRQCDTIVFVYPTWWSGQPAMLKGWLERVWVNGIAYTLPSGGGPVSPRLRNVRRVVAVTTHGSSKLTNAVEGEAGKRTITRSVRGCCGWRCRTTWLAMYGADTSTVDERTRFLDRVSERMRRLQ